MLFVLKGSIILHYRFNDGTFFSGALEVPFLSFVSGEGVPEAMCRKYILYIDMVKDKAVFTVAPQLLMAVSEVFSEMC